MKHAGEQKRARNFGCVINPGSVNLYELLVAFILGLVEGATEFLPVSSTGHLIVVADWLGFTGTRANTFNVFIQLGAILAIVWLYRATIRDTVVRLPHDRLARRFALSVAVAFIPAALMGLLFEDFIDEHLFNPLTVAIALIMGGVAILLIERMQPTTRVADPLDVTPRDGLMVGLAQILALIPGVSRSGSTIMGGYAFGLSRKAATEFSFFLAIPVMLAATSYKLFKEWSLLSASDVPMFAVGFITAFVSSIFVVRFLVSFVSRNTFTGFAWYRIAFGAFLLVLYFTGTL